MWHETTRYVAYVNSRGKVYHGCGQRHRFLFRVSIMPFKEGENNFKYATCLSALESSLLISAKHRDANRWPASDPGALSSFPDGLNWLLHYVYLASAKFKVCFIDTNGTLV